MKSPIFSAILRLVGKGDEEPQSLPVPLLEQPVKPQPSSISGASMNQDSKLSFDRLARRIAKGETISIELILPFLCMEARNDRAYVNYQLGCVYHYAGKIQQAKPYIERAWVLSGFNIDVLEAFKTIELALGDVSAIREAHKRLGLLAADAGDVSTAIEHFNHAHFAFAVYDKADKWNYDFDMMLALDRLSKTYKEPAKVRGSRKKIRVGYLLRGLLETNSILIRHILNLVQSHNRDEFEIFCFAPEHLDDIQKSAQGSMLLQKFQDVGYPVVLAKESAPYPRVNHLLAMARTIADYDLDILVASAGLVDYEQYFLCALRPAPLLLGLVQGPPSQFAPPFFDACIAWSKHPLMDTPVDCSLVQWNGIGEMRSRPKPISREDLSIPPDACVILSCGRIQKFQNLEHWHAVVDVLEVRPRAHYLVAGPSIDELAFLKSNFSEQILQRIHCLGWRTDVPNIMATADIILDTYPNGGGQALAEAMILSIPIVAHRNDFTQLFDQTSWSPVEDFISESRGLVSRGDFTSMKNILLELIDDESLRTEVGSLCTQSIVKMDISSAVCSIEQKYKALVERLGQDAF